MGKIRSPGEISTAFNVHASKTKQLVELNDSIYERFEGHTCTVNARIHNLESIVAVNTAHEWAVGLWLHLMSAKGRSGLVCTASTPADLYASSNIMLAGKSPGTDRHST